METSEIKARIASLLEVPLSEVILKQNSEVTANFSYQNGRYVIEYKDAPTLAHEFLHGCFSPKEVVINKPLNALEDYRITVKAEQYDKKLADCNNDAYSKEEVHKILKSAPDTEQGNGFKALAIASIPKQTKLDIGGLIDEYVNHPKKEEIKDTVIKARDSLSIDSSFTNLGIWAERLQNLVWTGKDRDEQSKIDRYHMEDLDRQEKAKEEMEKREDPEYNPDKGFAKQLSSQGEIRRLSSRDETVLIKALNNIIRNKSIGRKQNTIKGKLKTKRLGHFPSNYLFEKKDKPMPQTSLYILADISGSMRDGVKLPIVIQFLNSIRKNEVKNLKIEIRCFNAMLFKNAQIPYYEGDFETKLMFPDMPYNSGGSFCGFNDDAHWLKSTIEEINNDPTPNKALLILSDGEPAPCDLYDERDLKSISKILLPKSKIPYMSIGINSDSVSEYYAKYRVAYNPTELVELLLRYSRELVQC